MPVLDGLRAVSVVMVFISHLTIFGTASRNVVEIGTISGATGVSVFFVLSGYLITRLLLKEEEQKGAISLKKFYARRFLRIFPAAYAFLALVLVMSQAGFFSIPLHSYLASLLYIRNYVGSGHETAHLWSLAIEEQFYLLWPACLALLAPKDRVRGVICLIAAVWVWRCYVVLFGLASVGQLYIRTDLRIDTILVGCLLALVEQSGRLGRVQSLWMRGTWFLPATLLVLVSWLILAGRSFLAKTVETGVAAVLIGAIVIWFVSCSESVAGRWLQTPFVLWVGRLSYSLYLWQQVFMGPATPETAVIRTFPLNILLTFAAAAVSYYLVERPMLLLKDRYFRA